MLLRNALCSILCAVVLGCDGSDSLAGEVRSVSILAVDEGDEPVRLWAASLHRASDMEPLVRRNSIGSSSGQPSQVAVPKEPVRLKVWARGYHSVEETIQDPWRNGEQWRIPLEPLPRIQGTVLRDGEPVSGAVVWFREDRPPPEPGLPSLFRRRVGAIGSWWPPPYMGGAKTGEDGRFCLSFEREASVRLMAYASAGVGESRVIVLDADRDLVTVDIELEEPTSTLVGTVLLPEGREPGEIRLEGHGPRWFYIDTARDGTFRAEGLPPGVTSLGVARRSRDVPLEAASELRFSNEFPTHTTFWPPDWIEDTPFVVDLQPGEVHDVVLDLRARHATRLEGVFRLDGAPATLAPDGADPYLGWHPGRHATIEPADGKTRGREDLGRAPLDDEGGFSIGAAEADSYFLHLDLWLPDVRSSWDVFDRVSLSPEETTHWSLDVPSGSLTVRGLDAQTVEQGRAYWTRRGPGSQLIRVRASFDEDAVLRFPRIPAGQGELTDVDGRILVHTTVGVGDETRVTFD